MNKKRMQSKRMNNSARQKILIGLAIVVVILLGIVIYNASFNQGSTPKNPLLSPTPIEAKVNPAPTSSLQSEPIPGQIIVKVNTGVTDAQVAAVVQKHQGKIVKRIDPLHRYVITVPAGQEAVVMQELQSEAIVVNSEQDQLAHVFFAPNDQFFGNQWGLKNTGQTIKGSAGIANDDIGAESAWDVTKGSGVKVGIVDTGIDLNHPDLAGKVVAQKVFVTNSINDVFGHGTHVAGIISADTNNTTGVAGVCPDCQLIIAKSMNDSGSGADSDIAQGITWAVDQGAKVINFSGGGADDSQVYRDAISYATSKGTIIVAAAGNDGVSQKFYPAADSGVISVAATDNKDKIASFSNFGSWVQVSAPGVSIYSTVPTAGSQMGTTYAYADGTSMATPMVTGAIALLWASPYGTSNTSVIQRLYATADKIAGTGTDWVNGRIDIGKALAGVSPTQSSTTPTSVVPTFVCGGSPNSICTTATPSPTGSGSQNPAPSGSITLPPGTTVTVNPSDTVLPSGMTVSPCPTTSSVQAHVSRHRSHPRGALGNFMQQFLQFLMQLLKLLQQLLGGGNGGNPGPTPTPSITPSGSPSASPSETPSPTGNPCDTPSPSVNPSETPSTSPSSAPSEMPSTQPSASEAPSMSPQPSTSAAPTNPSVSVQPSGETVTPPCSVTSSVQAKSRHRQHPRGALGKLMQQFMQFFMQLLKMLEKLLGGTPQPNPSPTPTPSVSPSGEPSVVPSAEPSVGPSPSQSPCNIPTPSDVQPSHQPNDTPSVQPTVTGTTGDINFRGDFEPGNSSQYSALECANPSRQFQIVQSPVRQGKYAARIEEAPGDNWSNGSIRCLAANYGDLLHEGDDTYYAFSMYFPQKISYNLLWELHMRSDIYSVNANTSVAPYAVEAQSNGSLTFRILTGPANWNGSSWTGWSYYYPQIAMGLDNYPINTWIDFIVHIKATESNTGTVEVWNRTGNNPWPTTPQIARYNIPTLQYIPGGKDPKVPNTIHTSSDYIEVGLYKGGNSTSTTDVVYDDGFRRGTSKAAVMAEFP